MAFERYLYYILLVIAVVLAYINSKNDKRLVIICWLLFFSIMTESASDYFRSFAETKRYTPYHFYIPIEYCLVTFYLSGLLQISWLKKLLKISILFFIIFSVIISIYLQEINEFPSWQYNIEGTLIIIWCVISLFNLPLNPDMNIFKTFQFWFCIAFMVMFSGQFFMNGFFNSLKNTNPELIKKLIFIVYYVLNYLFYTLIIFGLLCSRPTRKYISQ
ncbi:MAG TPA: hypothetical protein VGP55_01805 [Chitinophagaceae bacterium]|nr:hypothetical protein [Chitinophagaceae bacterium]